MEATAAALRQMPSAGILQTLQTEAVGLAAAAEPGMPPLPEVLAETAGMAERSHKQTGVLLAAFPLPLLLPAAEAGTGAREGRFNPAFSAVPGAGQVRQPTRRPAMTLALSR